MGTRRRSAVAALCLFAVGIATIRFAFQAPADDGSSALWSAPGYVHATYNASLPRIAACARIRNEARYLREWIEFHRLVGIDHFYFFDDDSRDETADVLAPYVAAGVARVWPMSATPCAPHHARGAEVCADRTNDAAHGEAGFRDECLRQNPDGADWIAMLDVDEFAFPAEHHGNRALARHLAQECDPAVAYVLVRWHVFGAGGHRSRPDALLGIEAYRERGRADDRGCYPRLTCGDEFSPPICAKVLARPRCVVRQGTHYVVEARSDAQCRTLYAPEGAGRLLGKRAAPLASAWARAQHARCARPIHLNHYAVRSREDYVEKFERGRISSGARDAAKGLATKDGATGATTRALPAAVVADFLTAEAVRADAKANTASTRAELMLAEFARRDHSEVLDEAILRYAPKLRAALKHKRLAHHLPARMSWACGAEPVGAHEEQPRPRGPRAPAANHTAHDVSAARAERGPREALAVTALLRDGAASYARRSAHRSGGGLLLFAHIPKTAGTTLNAMLRAAATGAGATFCDMGFAKIEDRHLRRKLARRCAVVSAETDVSILPTLQRRAVLVVTFVREPLSRAASQVEHHLSEARLGEGGGAALAGVLASPALCPQLHRDALCATLSHPRKCRAGGWCALFQNHQTHVLAGAQHMSRDGAASLRRSSANLLCAASHNLRALPVVGLTHALEASMCLLFEVAGYGQAFNDCCLGPRGDRRGTCAILAIRAEEHSAAHRAAKGRAGAPATNKMEGNASSYLAKYLDDNAVLPVMYDGNRLDCALYDVATTLLAEKVAAARARHGDAPVWHYSSPPDYCGRGAAMLRAQDAR